MVKNLPSNSGDVGSIPGYETKIPHAAGKLSLHAKATEPAHYGARMLQLERSLLHRKIPNAAAEIQHAAAKIRRSQINKLKKRFEGPHVVVLHCYLQVWS